MTKHLKITLYTLGSVLILTGLVFGIFLMLRGAPDVVFPIKTHGSFIEQPHIVSVDGSLFIQWTVSVYCTKSGYEAQTVDYQSGGEGFWGGRDDAKCVPGNGGYQCRGEFLEEMKKQGSEWMVQAKNVVCPENSYFTSEAVKQRVE